MRAHSENAQRLAEWLAEQSSVEAVHYCGLPDHPGHAHAGEAGGLPIHDLRPPGFAGDLPERLQEGQGRSGRGRGGGAR